MAALSLKTEDGSTGKTEEDVTRAQCIVGLQFLEFVINRAFHLKKAHYPQDILLQFCRYSVPVEKCLYIVARRVLELVHAPRCRVHVLFAASLSYVFFQCETTPHKWVKASVPSQTKHTRMCVPLKLVKSKELDSVVRVNWSKCRGTFRAVILDRRTRWVGFPKLPFSFQPESKDVDLETHVLFARTLSNLFRN